MKFIVRKSKYTRRVIRSTNLQISSAYVLRGEGKINVERCIEYVGCRISTTSVIKDQTI